MGCFETQESRCKAIGCLVITATLALVILLPLSFSYGEYFCCLHMVDCDAPKYIYLQELTPSFPAIVEYYEYGLEMRYVKMKKMRCGLWINIFLF